MLVIPEEAGGLLQTQDKPRLYRETISRQTKKLSFVQLFSTNCQLHVRYLGGLCTTDNLGRVWPDTGPGFVFPN